MTELIYLVGISIEFIVVADQVVIDSSSNALTVDVHRILVIAVRVFSVLVRTLLRFESLGSIFGFPDRAETTHQHPL